MFALSLPLFPCPSPVPPRRSLEGLAYRAKDTAESNTPSDELCESLTRYTELSSPSPYIADRKCRSAGIFMNPWRSRSHRPENESALAVSHRGAIFADREIAAAVSLFFTRRVGRGANKVSRSDYNEQNHAAAAAAMACISHSCGVGIYQTIAGTSPSS